MTFQHLNTRASEAFCSTYKVPELSQISTRLGELHGNPRVMQEALLCEVPETASSLNAALCFRIVLESTMLLEHVT